MLPPPTLTFTLPSIHDETPLDCRVYHPQSLSPSPRSPPWHKHAAIIAHPYAPLGGSYDDPIVDIVATTLLRLGYLVGTFNFRGASGSAGRTSWTAKPERADYASFVGFMSYYVHYLNPYHDLPPSKLDPAPQVDPLSDGPTRNPALQSPEPPVLLLAGYSYGAMVTTQLPSLPTILTSFESPASGSAPAEVRLRAEHLAETQNTVLRSARAAAMDTQGPKSPRKSLGLGLRIGGDEENRKSHEARRSFSLDPEDRIRKGVAELRANWKAKRAAHRSAKDGAAAAANGEHRHSADKSAEEHDETNHLPPVSDLTSSRPAYLLVSPLQGIITHLATMSFSSPSPRSHHPKRQHSSHGKDGAGETHPGEQPVKTRASDEAEDKLVQNPTFAVYGDRDVFVAAKKLRDWARRLEDIPNSKYRAHEVSTASHFWVEEKVAYTMRDAVKHFAGALLEDSHVPGSSGTGN